MTELATIPTLEARTFEVERFYYDESTFLERSDYQPWFDLLTDDLVYTMPQQEFADRRTNRSLDAYGAHGLDEDKASIVRRGTWLLGPPTPEFPRPFRRMLITNVRVLSDTGSEVTTDSKFFLWELPAGGTPGTYVGLRSDRLRVTPEGLRLARRTVFIDSPVLSRAPTTFF